MLTIFSVWLNFHMLVCPVYHSLLSNFCKETNFFLLLKKKYCCSITNALKCNEFVWGTKCWCIIESRKLCWYLLSIHGIQNLRVLKRDNWLMKVSLFRHSHSCWAKNIEYVIVLGSNLQQQFLLFKSNVMFVCKHNCYIRKLNL